MSSRRDFLKSAASLAVTTLASGVTLYSRAGEASAANAAKTPRWGLLIDATKCTPDCSACVDACGKAYGWHNESYSPTDEQWIRKVNVTNPESGASFSAPVMCQHCANPPCVDVCPTGASFKRFDGIVLVNRHICIGCRYCMMACPYKARSFVHHGGRGSDEDKREYPRGGHGTVEACNLCVQRIDAGGVPHCVEACQQKGQGAILFGNLNDPESEIAKRVATYRTSRIRDDLGCEPGVHYQGIS
ncbi:MAG: 4Fe-4S dicluster domain-containing protein [Alphaproteobacteria bacterium]